MIEDVDVTCPCCWELITLEVELLVEAQDYNEDCPVCCRPMRVICNCDGGELVSLAVESAE